jgi:hypothetical protein
MCCRPRVREFVFPVMPVQLSRQLTGRRNRSVLRQLPHAAAAALMADVYADHKDEDNFLYITYRCGTGSCSALRLGHVAHCALMILLCTTLYVQRREYFRLNLLFACLGMYHNACMTFTPAGVLLSPSSPVGLLNPSGCMCNNQH